MLAGDKCGMVFDVRIFCKARPHSAALVGWGTTSCAPEKAVTAGTFEMTSARSSAASTSVVTVALRLWPPVILIIVKTPAFRVA